MKPYNVHTTEGALGTEDTKLLLISKAYEEIDRLEKELTTLRVRHGEALRSLSAMKTHELNQIRKHEGYLA